MWPWGYLLRVDHASSCRSDFISIDEILADLWPRLNGEEIFSNHQRYEVEYDIDLILSELCHPYDQRRVHLYSLYTDDSGTDPKSDELFQEKIAYLRDYLEVKKKLNEI
jgi:hypothetical protein